MNLKQTCRHLEPAKWLCEPARLHVGLLICVLASAASAETLGTPGTNLVQYTFENTNHNLYLALTVDGTGNGRVMTAGNNVGDKWAGGALAPGSIRSIMFATGRRAGAWPLPRGCPQTTTK
jgi:hypothetical protein